MATVILSESCENLIAEQVTIPAGAAVSEIFPTQGRAIVGLQMPAAWTAAKIGYKVSVQSSDTPQAAYDSGGNLEQTTVAAGKFTTIPIPDAIYAPFVRLWSQDGAGNDTNQAADRVITVLLRRYLGGS